jgi:PAS fold
VDINDAYAAATFIVREDVVGKSLFDVFPDNPADSLADGVSNLHASLKTVTQTGQPHAMAIQRYDIRDPEGHFVERYWFPINRTHKGRERRARFPVRSRRGRYRSRSVVVR